jgi:hypothetical protein
MGRMQSGKWPVGKRKPTPGTDYLLPGFCFHYPLDLEGSKLPLRAANVCLYTRACSVFLAFPFSSIYLDVYTLAPRATNGGNHLAKRTKERGNWNTSDQTQIPTS